MTSILIVDDQNTIQQILNSYIEPEKDLEVVGFAANGKEAVEKVQELQPDVVLMDIEMPEMNGLSATKEITLGFPNTQVIIFTSNDKDKYLNLAVKVGAKGYLLKTTPAEEIVKAIRDVRKGYFQLGPGLIEKYLHKVIKAQTNAEQISNLKELVENHSQLLEKISTGSDYQEKIFLSELRNIQFESRNIKKRINDLDRDISFIRKFLLISVLVFVVIIAILLVLILYKS
jgi:DNA-binding NarL/FixJ family response regulator